VTTVKTTVINLKTRLVSKTVLNFNCCRFKSNFDISDRHHVVLEGNLAKTVT